MAFDRLAIDITRKAERRSFYTGLFTNAAIYTFKSKGIDEQKTIFSSSFPHNSPIIGRAISPSQMIREIIVYF